MGKRPLPNVSKVMGKIPLPNVCKATGKRPLPNVCKITGKRPLPKVYKVKGIYIIILKKAVLLKEILLSKILLNFLELYIKHYILSKQERILATIDISKCVVNAPLYVMLHGYKVKEAF